MEDKISVIIPCYNAEQYVDRCLNSVVNQTIGIDKLEVICVNDASTDGTWDRLCGWEARYPESMLLINCEKNGRQGRARNIALEYASGAYIAFLDVDDWIETDAYEKLYQLIRKYRCDIVQFGFVRDCGIEDIWKTQKHREKEDFYLDFSEEGERKKLLVTALVSNGCWDKIYTKEFIEDHRLRFPEQRAYEDIYWGIMTQLYAKNAYFFNEKLYHYYVNQESTVLKKDEAYHMDIFYILKKVWEDCKSSGLLGRYPREIELNFLIYYYLGGLKVLALRYTDLKYKEYRLMCKTVMDMVPEYKDNPYLAQVLDDMQRLQISLIDQDISEEEFAQVVDLLRRSA